MDTVEKTGSEDAYNEDALIEAQEGFSTCLESIIGLSEIQGRLAKMGTISRAIAQEAREFYPSFDKGMPLSAYTSEPTTTRYSVAIESLPYAMAALITAAVGALAMIVWHMLSGGSKGGASGTVRSAVTITTTESQPRTPDDIISCLKKLPSLQRLHASTNSVANIMDMCHDASRSAMKKVYDLSKHKRLVADDNATVINTLDGVELELGNSAIDASKCGGYVQASIVSGKGYHTNLLKSCEAMLSILNAVKNGNIKDDDKQNMLNHSDNIKTNISKMSSLKVSVFPEKNTVHEQKDFMLKMDEVQDALTKLAMTCAEQMAKLSKSGSVDTEKVNNANDIGRHIRSINPLVNKLHFQWAILADKMNSAVGKLATNITNLAKSNEAAAEELDSIATELKGSHEKIKTAVADMPSL